MNSDNSFYSWLSLKTRKGPPSSVDIKILSYSAQYFKSKEKTVFFNWKISVAAAFFSVALVILLINRTPGTRPDLMTESPEMVLHYRDMELMADASNLTDEDWVHINGAYVK
jgi:hypothetical protein